MTTRNLMFQHWRLVCPAILLIALLIPAQSSGFPKRLSESAVAYGDGYSPYLYRYHHRQQPYEQRDSRPTRQAQQNTYGDPTKSIAGSMMRLTNAKNIATAMMMDESEESGAQDATSVCFENCSQCADMYGEMFEAETCAVMCLKSQGEFIPNCNDATKLASLHFFDPSLRKAAQQKQQQKDAAAADAAHSKSADADENGSDSGVTAAKDASLQTNVGTTKPPSSRLSYIYKII